MVRRTIAIVGGVIVLILLVLLVRSCFNARKENAIKNYANDSAELLRASKVEGDGLFQLLQGQGGADQATSIINQLNGYRSESASLVDRANRLDVPGDLNDAQNELLSVLGAAPRRAGEDHRRPARRPRRPEPARGHHRGRQADAGLPRQRRGRHAALPRRPLPRC